MKKLLLISIILLVSSCRMHIEKVTLEPITKTIQIEESKDDLYVKANNWMVESFVSAKSVIQFSDKEAGVVTGKYLMKSIYSNNYNVGAMDIYCIIKIQVKDGASKISITPEEFKEIRFANKTDNSYTREDAINQINELVRNYETYIKTDNSSDFFKDK